MLLVGDLIYDDELDLNCNYVVYDCRYDVSWQEAEVLYDSEIDKYKPLDIIVDMCVKCITITENKLIIEAVEN